MTEPQDTAANERDTDTTAETATDTTASAPLAVVGIGASAGGLAAFKQFLAAVPADTGLAFVLVPHLDPSHQSLMVELLARHSILPVCEAADDMTLAADRVYVIPPGSYLTISTGLLKLTAIPEPPSHLTGIDLFLRSLADAYAERAIGIVLSGTGSHGTAGLQAIKAHGGLALAQDPGTAEFAQMPQSVIAAGLADYVLAPEAMPNVLIDYTTHASRSGSWTPLPENGQPDELVRIMALLHARTRYDFRGYRKKMLLRRVQRRMDICHIETLAGYLERLQSDTKEHERLFRDLLIGVTSFFRDKEAFEVLEQQVINPLLDRNDPDTPVRVWVPGCSTGEEAYSIAMLLLEGFWRRQRPFNAQIFATDIDEFALETARKGRYPESIANDVSAERLKRFFIGSDSHYQVNKQLREAVVFAPQDLISDAPFSRMDLISCRNLLIYLETTVQRKIIALFHFALNEDGHLLLGSSESVGKHAELFATVSKKWRLYQRVGTTRRDLLEFPVSTGLGHRPVQSMPGGKQFTGSGENLAELTRRVLLQEYAPAAVLISQQFEILYYFGPVMNYLILPPGEPTRDLMSMAREGLRSKLLAACHKARREHTQVHIDDAAVMRDGKAVPVALQVGPLPGQRPDSTLLLVTFTDRTPADDSQAREHQPDTLSDQSSTVEQLEIELKINREELQNTIEEMECTNEELKASNEEVMSMNEELQSTNEELETSREELQSLNEELSTVNSQLQDKVQELEQSNNDIINLLTKTDISSVFLDPSFNIKLFTPPAAHLFNLRTTDVGRSLRDFSPNFSDPQLLDDAGSVLEDLVTRDREVETRDGRHLLRRIVPYRTQDNRIDGVVITFIDISSRVQKEQLQRDQNQGLEQRVAERTHELQQKTEELGFLMDNVPALYSYIDANEVYCYVNPVYEQRFNVPAERILGKTAREVLGHDNYAVAEPHIRAALAGQPQHYEDEFETPSGKFILNITCTPDPAEDGSIRGIFALSHDITERKILEQQLSASRAHLEAIINAAADGIITVDKNGKVHDFNPAAERIFDRPADSIIGQDARQILAPSCQACQEYPKCFLTGSCPHNSSHPQELTGYGRDGRQFPIEITSSEINHQGLVAVLIRDISERRVLEREVIDAATQEQARIGRELHDGIGQQLTALSMLAVSIGKKLLTAGNAGAAAEIDKLVEHLQVSLNESHRLAQGLSPVEIDPEGLAEALSELARDVRETSGIACSYYGTPELQVHDSDTALHIYRIAQEAVNNALKHASPERIDIHFSRTDHTLELVVEDDGSGIQTTDARQGQLGLHLMRYRAGIIGGELHIESPRGGGTRVSCRIPVQ